MDDMDEVLLKISERARKQAPLDQSTPITEPTRGDPLRKKAPEPDDHASEFDEPHVTDFDEPTNQPRERASDADIGVLVALPSPELDQVLDTFASQWHKEGREGVLFKVAHSTIFGEGLTIVAAVQNEMGMVPAAVLATKTMRAWRPKLLIMTGVCAGVRGKVNLGDIVVGSQVFDYGSGKFVRGRLFPDYNPVSLDDELTGLAISLASDDEALAEIRDAWPTRTGQPDTELRAYVGPIASGAAVVADDSVVEGIQKHKRSLLAIDMEAYGFARAVVAGSPPALFMVVKGAQDFADALKSDEFREYAAFVSTKFLFRFLQDHWLRITERLTR